MKFTLSSNFNPKVSRFLNQELPGTGPDTLPVTDPEITEPAELQELEAALWALARNPEGVEEAAALEAIINAEVADLVARGITLDTLQAYFEAVESQAPLEGDEIVGIAEEIEASVDEEEEAVEGEPLTDEEAAELQTMTNAEFLEIPRGDRLRLITTQNASSVEVAAGNITNLDFTFTFDGQYNEPLWRDTTAGQTLPPEVRHLTSGGQTYARNADSLHGEFFSASGQRFKIHEGTNISEMGLGDLTEIEERIETQLAEYEEAEERTDEDMLVARMAFEYGVQPEFVMAAFVDQDHPIETEDAPHRSSDEARLAAMPGHEAAQQLTPQYTAQLEDFLTEISRAEDYFNTQFPEEEAREVGRLNPNFAGFVLGEGYDQRLIPDIMLSAGYSQAEIEGAADYIDARQRFNSTGATNPLNAEILASGEVEVVSEKQDQVNAAVEACLANRSRYEAVAAQANVPWELIAAIHYRESSFNFNTYLHNGCPLGAPSCAVPYDIPTFNDWDSSAVHALGMKGACGDSPEAMANYAERFNGMGYRNRGLNSPYVWAGHPRYESQGGMFVADGQFSRSTRDPRVGVMPIVMVLRARQGMAVDADALIS